MLPMRRDPWFFGNVGIGFQVVGVLSTLLSGKSTCLVGNAVTRLETAVAEQLDVATPIAVASATSAFELILRDLAIGPGAEVIVPAFGWMSVPGAVVYTGARLRLADTDQGLHVGWPAINDRLTTNTRAVVLAHMRGFPAPDTLRIAEELRARGIALIEDCAQAWGSRIGTNHVGTCGDYAFFSTQHFKLVATGEGGIVTARAPDAAARLRWLSGRTDATDRSHPWPRNVRMAEAQAAAGLPQVRRLWHTVSCLRSLGTEMVTHFTCIDGLRPQPAVDRDASANGVSVPVWCESDEVATRLADLLIAHRVPAFRPGKAGDLHNALAWPVPAIELESLTGLRALSRYVDVPVPLLSGRARRGYTRRVEIALEEL